VGKAIRRLRSYPLSAMADAAPQVGLAAGPSYSGHGEAGAYGPPKAVGPKKVVKGNGVNERMLATLQANPDSRGWSAEKWRVHLGCAKSTVVESRTWQTSCSCG
jgi:hypothetical protein